MAGPDAKTKLRIQQAIERQIQTQSRLTQRELDLQSRRSQAEAEYELSKRILESKQAQGLATAEMRERFVAKTATFQELRERASTFQEQRTALLNERLRVGITHATTPAAIRSDVAGFKRDFDVQRMGYAYASQYTGFDLEKRTEKARSMLEQVHSYMVAESEDPTRAPEEKAQAIRRLGRTAARYTRGLAVYEAAQQIQHRRGADEPGVLQRADVAISNYEKMFQSKRIEEGVERGAFGSYKDAQKRQIEIGEQLVAAKRQLVEGVKLETKQRQKLIEEIDNLSKESAENADVMAEMKRQNKNATQGGGRFGATISGIGAGMQVAGTIGSAYIDYSRFKEVGSELALMDAKIGYAQLGTRQYMDARAMAQGDMGALMRIAGGAYSAAAGFGANLKEKERSAVSAGRYAGGLSAFGGLLTDTSAGVISGRLGGIPGMLIGGTAGFVKGVGGIASTAGDIAKTTIALEKGIPQAQVDIEAQAKSLQLISELNTAQAAQAQTYMDVTRNYAGALRGVGGGRFEKTLNTTLGSQRNLARLGLGEAERTSLLGGLKQAMGVNMAAQGTNAAMQAAQWSARGYLESPQQYAQLMGQMTGVGGGVKELGDILKSSIMAGLDSSKNIQQMVSGIASISSKAAITGMSVAPGAMETLLSTTAAMNRAGVDKNIQTLAGQQIVNTMSQFGGGFGYDLQSIYGMQNAARFGIRDSKRAALFAGTGVTDFNAIKHAIQNNDYSTAKRIAEQHGFEDKITGDRSADMKFIEKAVRGRIGQELIGAGAPIMSPKAWRAYEEFVSTGKQLPEWAQKELGLTTGVAAKGGINITGVTGYIAGGQYDSMTAQEAAKRANLINKTRTAGQIGGTVGGVAAVAAAGAEQQLAEFDEGRKLVGDIKNLGPALQAAVQNIKWDELAKTAAKAVETMNVPVGNLNSTVSSLNQVLGATVSRLETLVRTMDSKGIKGANTPVVPNSLDTLKQTRRR